MYVIDQHDLINKMFFSSGSFLLMHTSVKRLVTLEEYIYFFFRSNIFFLNETHDNYISINFF